MRRVLLTVGLFAAFGAAAVMAQDVKSAMDGYHADCRWRDIREQWRGT